MKVDAAFLAESEDKLARTVDVMKVYGGKGFCVSKGLAFPIEDYFLIIISFSGLKFVKFCSND